MLCITALHLFGGERVLGRSGRPWRRVVAQAKRELPKICHLCSKPIDMSLPHNDQWSWTLDHIIPLALRPDLAEEISNVLPAHRHCNSSKGKKVHSDKTMPRSSRRWQ
ncbi:HNH endonuclease [Streptomyces sp. NPDC055085]